MSTWFTTGRPERFIIFCRSEQSIAISFELSHILEMDGMLSSVQQIGSFERRENATVYKVGPYYHFCQFALFAYLSKEYGLQDDHLSRDRMQVKSTVGAVVPV
jgi:hypothetical protein